MNKTCFQCFRIPTIIKTAAPGPGTILAFAEARRGQQYQRFHADWWEGYDFCPDFPDTRVVVKRSADGGVTWSPLSVFTQPPGRAENGHCQNQAAPVVDPVTKVIFVA